MSATQPQGDAGGNKVTLTCCGNELHAFWDDVLGTSKTVSSAITVAKTLPAPDATLAAKSDARDWVAESFDAAKETAYEAPPIGPGDGPFQLTASYKTAAKKVAQERVALAGARLANLLNMELK